MYARHLFRPPQLLPLRVFSPLDWQLPSRFCLPASRPAAHTFLINLDRISPIETIPSDKQLRLLKLGQVPATQILSYLYPLNKIVIADNKSTQNSLLA